LVGFSRYDYNLELIFKFLLVFKICFLMQYECMMSYNMLVLYVPHQKKKLSNIDGICIIGGNSHSSLWIVLTRQSYAIVVSVPAEEHNRYIFIYIATYPPSDVHVFNVVWTSLHMLWERIHVLQKWPQDIPRPPHVLGARSWLIAQRTRNPYHTIGIVLKKPHLEGTCLRFTSPSRRKLNFLPWRRCVVTEK
jgi:hypothetical protein